jgi:hypothetical protein
VGTSDHTDERLSEALTQRGDRALALVDGRNVQRSRWPNVPDADMVRRACEWAEQEGVHAVVVFDGNTDAQGDGVTCTVVPVRGETADEWIIRQTAALHRLGVPFVLVTSDRELRRLAGSNATRIIGGGSFLALAP